jgi:uncharacterized membrane protein
VRNEKAATVELSWELVMWEMLAALDVVGACLPAWPLWLRAPVGLLMTLIAPGYLALPWVRPRLTANARPERWFFTFLLSMAATIGLGLAYAYLHIRLNAVNLAVGQAGLLTMEVGAAAVGGRYRPLLTRHRYDRVAYLSLLVMAAALTGVTVLVGSSALAPRPALYLTDVEGHLEHFPYAVPAGASFLVTVHVTGLRGEHCDLLVRADGVLLERLSLEGGPNGEWSRPFRLPTRPQTQLLTVTFVLQGPHLTRTVWIRYWTGTALP